MANITGKRPSEFSQATINSLRNVLNIPPIELTLAELQALQFTDAPAPTGITITPDAVGDNPVTWFYKIKQADEGGRTLFSDTIEVIQGDQTTEIHINYVPTLSGINGYVFLGLTPTDFNYSKQIYFTNLPFTVEVGSWEMDNGELYQGELLAQPTQLLNNLSLGQQYYVTDKNWLLYVDQPTVLKPVKGSLHIFNGETLPEGIVPLELLIDTGIISDNLDVATGTPIPLLVPEGYIPFFKMDIFSPLNFALGDGTWYIYTDLEDITEKRNVFTCLPQELSYPIPVPHIVSAETSEDGANISILFNNNMLDGNLFLSDFIILCNSVVVGDLILIEPIPDNTVYQLSFDTSTFLFGDIITVSIASGSIKNTWGGLLAEVVDYPVVNNVPAPPIQILAARTRNSSTVELVTDGNFIEQINNCTGGSFAINGVPVPVGNFGHDGDYDSNLLFIAGEAGHAPGDVITFTYSEGNVVDSNGRTLTEVTNLPVVNNADFYPTTMYFLNNDTWMAMSLDVLENSVQIEDFTVTRNGIPNTITGFQLNNGNAIYLDVTDEQSPGDDVRVSFTRGHLMDVDGIYLAHSFTNLIAVPD